MSAPCAGKRFSVLHNSIYFNSPVCKYVFFEQQLHLIVMLYLLLYFTLIYGNLPSLALVLLSVSYFFVLYLMHPDIVFLTIKQTNR